MTTYYSIRTLLCGILHLSLFLSCDWLGLRHFTCLVTISQFLLHAPRPYVSHIWTGAKPLNLLESMSQFPYVFRPLSVCLWNHQSILTGWPACHPAVAVHHSHAALLARTFPGNRQEPWRVFRPEDVTYALNQSWGWEHSFGAKSLGDRSRQERPTKWPLVYCIRDCFASAQMKTPMLLLSTVNIFKIYIYIF